MNWLKLVPEGFQMMKIPIKVCMYYIGVFSADHGSYPNICCEVNSAM